MGAVSVFMTGNYPRQPVDEDGPLSSMDISIYGGVQLPHTSIVKKKIETCNRPLAIKF